MKCQWNSNFHDSTTCISLAPLNVSGYTNINSPWNTVTYQNTAVFTLKNNATTNGNIVQNGVWNYGDGYALNVSVYSNFRAVQINDIDFNAIYIYIYIYKSRWFIKFFPFSWIQNN